MFSFIKMSNFINTYERKIKNYREAYYRYISKHSHNIINIDFCLLSSIVSIFFLISSNFTIRGLIITFACLVILNIVSSILARLFDLTAPNNYIREIRRLGFPTIGLYEAFLKSYLTGDKGYYEKTLAKLKKQYNINEQVPKIQGANGEIYNIWLSSNQDEIYLLNENTLYKPEIITIRMNNIRYFRIDNRNKNILLKTDIEYYRFDMSALDTLNEILSNKRFDNLKKFTPEQYINDFEIYIHHFLETQKSTPTEYNHTNYEAELNKLLFYIIILCTAAGLLYTLKYDFLKIIITILIVILNYVFGSLISFRNTHITNEFSVLKVLNENPDCRERFDELKIALGISESFDKIYSKDNACYYTWVANGYFHIFLNVIYRDVSYMSVKLSDIVYYRGLPTECIIKIKDKTLEFRHDAKKVFDKILPNRDYDWLRKYEKNNR